MINDVSSALLEWQKNITGRRTPGGYVNGRWVEGTPEPIEFKGVIQVATPKERETLPEGDRLHGVIKIHTKFNLIPEADGFGGDIILNPDDNEEYIVKDIALRTIGAYNKALLVSI
jgi:hypothetical protein